jgi:hypothetical protein
MSKLGALRDKRYHAASALKYMSGIMEAVTKSTHGYFKSVPAVSDLFALPAIAIPYTERRSMTATVIGDRRSTARGAFEATGYKVPDLRHGQ